MSRDAIKTWLRGVPLFSELSPEELEALAATARSVSAKRHSRIFEEGDAADSCFVLTSGRARVVLGGWGDTEIILGAVKPKMLVGEIALFNRSTRSASLVASEDCHLLRIPLTSFERLRKNSAFENRLIAHVAGTLLHANEQVRMLSTTSIMARVAGCLGRIARQEGQLAGGRVVIPRKKHQELADMIGCSRETVSRKLEALRRKKYVTWDKSTMTLDIEGLQRHLRSELDRPGRLT
jgi:CRP-like cAMP-binding protein